jgi:hypothetical protein
LRRKTHTRISMYPYRMGKQGFDVKLHEKWNSPHRHEIISQNSHRKNVWL